MHVLLVTFLSLGWIYGASAQDESDIAGALATYVTAPDSSYSWRLEDRFEHRGSEFLGIRLHSQNWRGSLWKHQLYLIKPRRLAAHDQAVLVVAGGRWRDAWDKTWPATVPDEVDIFSRIARRLESIVVVVAQIPFQPLFDLSEDQLIAFTFDEYLRTRDAGWPLLLPMVKSVVRAMDAAQIAADSEWQRSIDRFTVVGGSKRGWTTWLTGAADTRVSAIMPIVIDALNMSAHFPYQTEVWGSPSVEISPYTDRNLHVVLSSEAGRDLRDIVDPFSYRAALNQPKLITIATNDAYFPVDSLNLYWSELQDPKYVLYLPNDGHSTRDFRRIFRSLNVFHRSNALGDELPEVDWSFDQDVHEMRLSIRSRPTPVRVRAWTSAVNSRDFRNATWRADRVRRRNGTYTATLRRPEQGHSAIFAELTYGRGRSSWSISTNLCVMSALAERQDSPGIEAQKRICGGL